MKLDKTTGVCSGGGTFDGFKGFRRASSWRDNEMRATIASADQKGIAPLDLEAEAEAGRSKRSRRPISFAGQSPGGPYPPAHETRALHPFDS
jgi:hypothetical protein